MKYRVKLVVPSWHEPVYRGFPTLTTAEAAGAMLQRLRTAGIIHSHSEITVEEKDWHEKIRYYGEGLTPPPACSPNY